MPYQNYTSQLGLLTRDPELRYTKKGTPVVSFGIAVNEPSVDSMGNRTYITHFFECEAWKKIAEIIADKGKKGGMVLVEGGLKYEEWHTDYGKRSRVKINARNVQFFQYQGKNGNGTQEQQTEQKPKPRPKPQPKVEPPPKPEQPPLEQQTPPPNDCPF